jgi:hypothetical protein
MANAQAAADADRYRSREAKSTRKAKVIAKAGNDRHESRFKSADIDGEPVDHLTRLNIGNRRGAARFERQLHDRRP